MSGSANSPATTRLGRGPASLGRNTIVSPGQPSPPEWTDAPRIVVEVPAATQAEQLREAAQHRRGMVFEVAVEHDRAIQEPFRSELALHSVGPRVRFNRELLQHMVYANSIDLRDGAEPWPTLLRAITLGARAVSDGVGDVELRDGTRAWLDGGPVRFTPAIAGVAVLHRVAVEHGSLRPSISNDSSADLAADQLAAVTHEGGAARIIAPAGSGKTRVLTERARHLVQQWQLPTSAITLIAFNKRAQEEIAARTTDMPGLQVRTLNAIALAIINGSSPFAKQPQRLATIDEPEVRRLIGKLVKFPRVRNADPVATWIEALSLARLGLVDPAKVETRYDGEVDGFADAFARYREILARQSQVDFDEQIFRAIELLLRDPEARAAAQRSCRLLLVDEFQDLTPAHLLLVRLLAGADAAVFGVGDDDQTIYGYNGADPAWLIDFGTHFPGAGAHPLEVNYRCPAGVVRAADTLLRHNRRRVPKSIRASHTGTDGFMVAPSTGNSVAITVQAVQTAIGAGLAPRDIAVLTRVNSLQAPVQVALLAAGIPTNGGVGSEFLERTAVRATLAWLRLARATGEFSAADVGEALRRPSRPLHPRIAGWVGEQTSLVGLRRLATRITTEKDSITVDQFAADIDKLQKLVRSGGTTEQLLTTVRDSFGLASSISKLDAHRHGMNRTAQGDDLTALAQLAVLQPDPLAFEQWLRSSLTSRSTADGVTLATVHRVKGQEWPFVIVHHADADQYPHRLADDIEEERRLFHVAITRASRDVLVVPSDKPSPFISNCSTEPSAKPEPVAVVTSTAATKSTPRPPTIDSPLFDELRALRIQLAAGKPAFIVFADSVLRDIAAARPTSLDQLAAIKGIGPEKLKQYGAAFLTAIADTAN